MTAENKQGLKIVLTYVAVWIAVLVLQLILMIPYFDADVGIVMTDAEQMRVTSISNLALYLTLFLIFIYMLRSYLKLELTLVKNDLRTTIKIIAYGLLGLFAVVYATSLIMSILGVTENSENQELLNNLVTAATFDKISLVLFSVFLAPFVEEIVFRKAVFGFLEKVNIPLAIIISGLSFGFIHVLSGDYIQLIIYGSLGLALAFTYYKSDKNIIAVIGIHMAYNLLITIVMFAF